jgi:hypothetical protein
MEHIREQQLAGLAPDEVLGEPEPDAVKVRRQNLFEVDKNNRVNAVLALYGLRWSIEGSFTFACIDLAFLRPRNG